ncbi:MAG: cupin domain-containing protein [Acidimicrobiales bacterium]
MAEVDVVRSQIIDIGGADWDELLPGVSAKRLWSDAATNRICMLTRFSPGATLPRHAHNGDELVFVIEGVVADEFGAVTAGNVGYRPNGCAHTVRSDKGATALAVVTGGVGKAGDGSGPASLVIDLPATPWVDMMAGIRQKRFWADADAGRAATVNRFEPGAQLPKHRHNGDELVFVIEGTIEDEAGVLRPGQLGYRPDGCAHTVSSPNGATVVAFLWGGIETL